MCGIVGYIGKQDVKTILVDGLRELEYRGYDSAGIAILSDVGAKDAQFKVRKCVGKIAALQEQTVRYNDTGSIQRYRTHQMGNAWQTDRPKRTPAFRGV